MGPTRRSTHFPLRTVNGATTTTPHSHTDWRISRHGIHRFKPRVSPRPQQAPTSPPSCRTPFVWSTLSGASTPHFTPFNSPLLPKIHNLLSRPLSKMYRKIRDARYVTTSILRHRPSNLYPSPLPSVEEIKRTILASVVLQQVFSPTPVVKMWTDKTQNRRMDA